VGGRAATLTDSNSLRRCMALRAGRADLVGRRRFPEVLLEIAD
jgi:hypothetical protein